MNLFLFHRRAFLSTLLAIALAVFASQPVDALGNEQPRIVKLVPSPAADGTGQLLTIQGFNLYDPSNPALTQVSITQGDLTALASVSSGPSNPNEVYVRLPTALSAGAATLFLRTTDDNLVSAPSPFTITAVPAPPEPRSLVAMASGFPVLTSAARGSEIGIPAYGVDSRSATAIFIQGATPIFMKSLGSSNDKEKGVINKFRVPSTLAPGKVLVQLRVTVDGVSSDPSFALLLNVL